MSESTVERRARGGSTARRSALRSLAGLPLPVGQRVRTVAPSLELLTTAIESSLRLEEFALARRAIAPPRERRIPGRDAEITDPVIGERRLRRVPTRPAMRLSIGVLAASGVILGAMETILTGNLLLGVPWGLAGLAVGLLFWWRYGRTYESEVVRVRILGERAAPPAAPLPVPLAVELEWTTGRVRSVLFGGERAVIGVVDCPIWLMTALTSAMRRVGKVPESGVPAVPLLAA